MPLDQSFIGRTYPVGQRYEVGVEKIREFADAIGDPNPVYRDVAAAQAAGHPTVIAPPTFTTIINLRIIETIVADPDLGLDWSRVVQGEQSFSYHRPIVAGDSLGVLATIDNVMNRGGHGFMTVRADISDADDQPVAVVAATVVVRGDEA
ncbi:MAG TPA: MaoC family dehydratase N-terminal domain-containing protein [Pseudonocardiaceae bacterium]